jgi:putrescine aminotransferase
LRALCRNYGILFVADEVITGFGRLGSLFASELWDLDPDIMTLAKGITSGYMPLGATLLSDAIGETLLHGGYFAHGFTYSGHPVSCAAALANLALLQKDNLVERVKSVAGPHFQQRLHALAGHPIVGEVRGLGLIGAIELLQSDGKKPPLTGTLGITAAAIAREEGVIVRGIRNLLALAPPLTISIEEMDILFAAVGRTLDRLRLP